MLWSCLVIFFLPSIKNFKGSHCSKKWLLYLGHKDALIGKDSLSYILASHIFLSQDLMLCGVFRLHHWAMWNFAVIKSKWVSSLNIGLCLVHLVLFDLGLKIVLFLEWTSRAEKFFLITHNPITYAEITFFFPTASPTICWDEEIYTNLFGGRNLQVNSLIHKCYNRLMLLLKRYSEQILQNTKRRDPNAYRCSFVMQNNKMRII